MNNNRRNRVGVSNRILAIAAAVAIHLLIVAALFVNFTRDKPEVVIAQDAEKIDVVRARAVDDANVKKIKNELKKKELEKKRQQDIEKQRLQDLKNKADEEERRIEDLKKKQLEEKEKAQELERQRKEIALKKKKEEQQRKKEQAARKKKEQERKRKELEAKRRLEKALEAERAFQAEQQAKQRTTTLANRYSELIRQKVQSRWNRPPNSPRVSNVIVKMRLSPRGDVLSAKILGTTGSPEVDRSIETAVYNATPLPIPSHTEHPQLHKAFQDAELEFDLEK